MLQPILNYLYSVMFAIIATFGINLETEQPRYEVIERVTDSVEIRRYPTRIVAETAVDATKSDNPRSDAYRMLANYIIGENKARQKVDMTSPVEIGSQGMTIAKTTPIEVYRPGGVLLMRFFMPAKYKRDALPEPTDPRVKLIELPPVIFAALRFSGSTSDAAVQGKYEELRKALQPTSWKIAGSPTAYFYNPPWTIPLLRTNEVVVLVYGESR